MNTDVVSGRRVGKLRHTIVNAVKWMFAYLALYWSVWPIGAYISSKEKVKTDEDYAPRVVFVVPVRNKEDTVYEVLESLYNQSYKPSRIIVIDDHSTDGSLHEVLRFAERYFGDLVCNKVSDNEERCYASKDGVDFILIKHLKMNLGKQESVNKAVSVVSSSLNSDERRRYLIGLVDADTKLHRDWLKNSLKYHADPEVAATYGWVLLWDEKTRGKLKLVRDVEYKYLLPLLRTFTNPRSHWTMSGSNILYKLEILVNHPIPDGMKENAAEDLIHTIILQSRGFKIIFVPEAVVYSKEELDAEGLIKQTTRWMKGTWYTIFRILLPNSDLLSRLTRLHKLQMGAFLILPYYLLQVNSALLAGIITLNMNYLVWPAIDFAVFFLIAVLTYVKYKDFAAGFSLVEIVARYPLYYLSRNIILIPYFRGLKEYLEMKRFYSSDSCIYGVDS